MILRSQLQLAVEIGPNCILCIYLCALYDSQTRLPAREQSKVHTVQCTGYNVQWYNGTMYRVQCAMVQCIAMYRVPSYAKCFWTNSSSWISIFTYSLVCLQIIRFTRTFGRLCCFPVHWHCHEIFSFTSLGLQWKPYFWVKNIISTLIFWSWIWFALDTC